MARVKLEALPAYAWQTELEVRVGDLNYGNHLGNDALLRLLHEARLRWLATLGVGELDLGDGATGLIMTDCIVNYAAEAFRGDRLTVATAVVDGHPKVFRLAHRVTRGDERVALAEIGFMAYDYANRRPARLPRSFHDALVG